MLVRYDERSDVWSLGCIVLELATCGFLDVSTCSLSAMVSFVITIVQAGKQINTFSNCFLFNIYFAAIANIIKAVSN